MPHLFGIAVASVLAALLPRASAAEGFLTNAHPGNRLVSLEARSEELQAALGAVLGCRGNSASDDQAARTARVHKALTQIWRTLPKNQHGRVEWRLVRYMAHRHFMHRFGVLVRGLEPTIQVNASHAGEAEILSEQAPSLARQITASPAEHGFSLEDAAVMVAALEQLLFDSDAAALERVYADRGHATQRRLGQEQMQMLMRDYFVRWMLGEDEEGATILIQNPTMLDEHIPHWDAIKAMVDGEVAALHYARTRAPRAGFARTTFTGEYSFEDALEIAGSIGRDFAYFWEGQCQNIKASLVAMDSSAAGRVRLADFYGANKDGEWRFGESEEYLRELGALDETSAWRGKQVMIPNYMQAVSNCIVTRPHYLVCCLNECEEILGQVEAAVGAPLATEEEVLLAVGDLTNGDDDDARINDAMRDQLRRMAEAQGGKVPLHGRLFAQWLHHAFPRECPFPHRAGTAAARTPTQFGESFAVSSEDVNKHVAEDIVQKDLGGANTSADLGEWMSQWSEEEELLTDYSAQLREPWGASRLLLACGTLAALMGLMFFTGGSAKPTRGFAAATHSHYV